MREFILTIQDLAGELGLCLGRPKPLLPDSIEVDAMRLIDESKALFQMGLQELDEAFRNACCPADLTHEIDRMVARWDVSYGSLHSFIWKNDMPPDQAIPLLGLSARFRATLLILQQAIRQARSLRMDGYLGDVSL